MKTDDDPFKDLHSNTEKDKSERVPIGSGVGEELRALNISGNATSNSIPLTELEQINAIQRMNTNFIFLFGAAQRGKTVVTSSIINFLSSVEAGGDLSPFNVGTEDDRNEKDHGHNLYKKILRGFAEKRFPSRTVLVGNDEPIYVNVRFTPKNIRDNDPINLTFLEMPGDALQRIDSPDGGRGEIPESIDVFFRTTNVSISFILLTEHGLAAKDDLLMAAFIDYVRNKNREFSDARLLLLVAKWDKYDGGLSIEEFVRLNMPVTHNKLHDDKHSVAEFSIGVVDRADGKDFIKTYNPIPAKKVVNWIYINATGKALYKKKFWPNLRSKFMKYI